MIDSVKGRKILKKVVCIVLILMMLAGNFITPAKIIAEEINENRGQSEVAVDEEKTSSSTESNNLVNNSESSENNNFSNDEENADSSIAGSNEEKAENKEINEQENSEGIDEIAKSNEDLSNENANMDNAELDNEAQKEDNIEEGSPSNNILKSSNNIKLGTAKLNSAQPTASILNPVDELKNRLIPLTKENFEVKLNNDNHEIRTFGMQFLYGAELDEAGNLVWTPTNTAEGHQFSFRINYAISGLKELPAESIKITIPKSIIRNRNKDLDDRFIMSVPTSEEWDGTTEFAYIENEDYLVMYNPAEIPAGLDGYIEVAYETKSKTFSYRDYDKTNTDLIINGGTGSDPFYATIAVKSGEDTLTNITDEKNIFIDTTAKIVSTQKRYPTIYTSWNSSWMEQKPADADDYYYLVWEISTNISQPTQPYNFKIEDFVTDLTEGTTGEDYEFIGYKLAGERYYSDKNAQTNRTTAETRYDYVLTRHKKSTYTGIKYTLKNSETATVDPIDQVDEDTSAKSQNIFYWDPSFVPPTGHFELYKYGNNTGFNGKYSNYELEKLQNKEVDELNNFKYRTETVGYAYPWTIRDGGSSDNPEDYGYNNVNYETWDDTLNLEEDSRPVNYEDYYLNDLSYTISNNDVEFDEFFQKFNSVSPKYEDNEEIIFYGKFNGGEDWIQIGTYNLKTKKITPNREYVEEMTTSKITFKQGVHATGWRFTTSNKHYYTNIEVIPHYVLTNSEYVSEKIAGKDVIRLQNTVNTKITDHNNEAIFERERIAIDYARVTYYDSGISKGVSSVSNNVVKRNYNVTWKVNAWETATGGTGQAEYIEQQSGKFYDLIPFGGVLDTSSIQVQTNLGFLEDNEFSYEIIQNYNNSGRAMLIITMDKTADWYTAFYKTVHSWDSIKDFGRNVLNPVGFETGNEKITHGHPDNGGNLSADNKALYANLDSETDANKFLYAESTYDINALTATTSGLYKKVKNSKEAEYSYDTQVEAGGDYSYKYRFQNTFVNKAKNLVFFDSLENFKIVNTEEGTVKTSGWKGTLQTIDLTQLRKKGIDPVVYISTQEDLDLEIYNDLTDTTIWEKVTETTDLSKAKAIAIDMRKDINGNDFILDAGDSIIATVHMKAPENIIDEYNPYTYNNIYIKNTLIDELNGEKDFYIHQDYTRVKYYIIADVPVRKVSAKNKNLGIEGITFRLYGTSIYGTEIDKYVTSSVSGNIIFKDIEVGEYILQEYEATPDWLEDHTEHIVSITRNREVYVDNKLVSKEKPALITNEPRIHTNVTFIKEDIANKHKTIEGVKFKLSGISDYGNEILMYAISVNGGIVNFENVEKGKYELVEVATAEGYILNNAKYRVVVDENGNYDIQKQIINNIIKTEEIVEETIKYSHTPNINDEGYASGNYDYDYYMRETVTIPGADKLEVIVYYGTEGAPYDWVSVYDAPGAPTSISGQLGGGVEYDTANSAGYQNACKKWEKTIQGNTVEFYFESDYSAEYYGYYAIVKGIHTDKVTQVETEELYESVYDNGKYIIYNEPYHSFYFVKKDAYNYEKLGGAKFRLYGCSNNGNTYDETVTSIDKTGYVNFENLESGTYILKEITPPNTNETTYVVDNVEHIVEVFENGKVTLDGNTIWPLSEVNDEPYTWYNKRNKGQITVTKKWVDNLTNEERQEPTIYISTKKPEQTNTKAYFRTVDNSKSIIDYARTRYEQVTAFKRNTTLSEEQVLAKSGVVRIDNDSENNNKKYKIYSWVEDKTLYWWTKADYGVLPADLSYYFYYETGLNEIDWTGIYKNGYWTGTSGAERMSESIINMRNMFYNCCGIENLNIDWFNNSAITLAENMEYAFGNNGTSRAGMLSALNYITIGSNFKLFETSILSPGAWINETTNTKYENTELIGTIEPGIYKYIGVEVKYAVQIYGIKQDKDENGNTLGLTFGPATGQNEINGGVKEDANYNSAYITHTYEPNGNGTYKVVIVRHDINEDGTEEVKTKYLKNSNGNYVTRTASQKAKYDINMHELTWEEISMMSKADPSVFTDCMLCGDTKSVQINLKNGIAGVNGQSAMGDGGMLYNAVNQKFWDDECLSDWGPGPSYGSSRIFFRLKTIYNSIEEELKIAIAEKLVNTDGKKASSSVWLFSCSEVCLKTDNYYWQEGNAYQKFTNTDSVSFISNDIDLDATTARVVYNDISSACSWWLRSFGSEDTYEGGETFPYAVGYDGSALGECNGSRSFGTAFGFCIK